MGFLVLSEDEVALLRFTCDLFFVEESPLFHVDAEQREPADYEAAYEALLKKKALDPRGFRVTDEALNRLAPVTECNARVVHLHQDGHGHLKQNDFFLLDDIAVQHFSGEKGHAFGADMDQDELVDYFARRMVARRSDGDATDLRLSTLEYMVFALLINPARLRSPSEIRFTELKALLGRSPTKEWLTRDLMSPAGGNILSMMQMRASSAANGSTGLSKEKWVGSPLWDDAIAGLLHKGALTKTNHSLRFSPSLLEIVKNLSQKERHTFVRYDFGHEEWLMRENTFLSLDGSLIFIGMDAGGMMQIKEMCGESLNESLQATLGPLAVQSSLKRVPDFRSQLSDWEGRTKMAPDVDPLTTLVSA